MIDWDSIKDGAVGFEQMAREYVRSEFQFPYGEWKETKQTRDGNKDAYTVIIGYHPHTDPNETWWMEAKYSSLKRRTYLTRFRLDATIVSSVFHKRVSKIIFVTNLEIHSKTISDIRIALQKSIGCNEVYFSTQQVLEYWLLRNPLIYKAYFSAPLPSAREGDALFVSEDISVYPYPNERGCADPCTYFYTDKLYYAYFKVISNITCQISLSPAQAGVRIEEKHLQLSCGETALRVLFQLTDKFQPMSLGEDGREFYCLDLFRINKKISVLLKTPLEVLPNTELHLKVHAQKEILSELCKSLYPFRRQTQPRIFMIYGESGTGKSYTINQFLRQKSMKNEHHYYYNFTENATENAKRLLWLAFYLILPYVAPDQIDPAYLSEIGEDSAVTRDLILLAGGQDQPSHLEQLLEQHCDRHGKIFPEYCELSPRYVFLDNIHHLTPTAWRFLRSIIDESFQKNCPVLFLLAGQTHVMESSGFQKLRQRYPVQMLACTLRQTDVIENIRLATSLDMKGYEEVIQDYFPNLILLCNFLIFLQSSGVSATENLDMFLHLYFTFINGNLNEKLIQDQFAYVMEDSAVKEVCLSVYTAPNGIPLDDSTRNAVYALLQSGLVKLNEENRIIPFHDLYLEIFRRTYRVSKRAWGIPYSDELDEARDRVFFPTSTDELASVAERITKLRKSGQFYSVCYILDSYFEEPYSQQTLKNPASSDLYYQMYFDYAYAAVNCSRRHTGYDYFEQIYLEIENKTSLSMRLLKLELLFELMNSNYNIFQYKKAMGRYCQFQTAINILVRAGQLSPCLTDNEFYVLCEDMRILIQSARGRKKSEQMFLRWREVLMEKSYRTHYIDLHIRYAHTLYTVAPDRALSYTMEAYVVLNNEGYRESKLWYLVQFQYLYLQLLVNHDISRLSELEEVTDGAEQNYYSSFRHRNLALCAILYKIGDVQKADGRFLKDMAHPRRLRDKLCGFYFETLALHHLAHNDVNQAIAALENAAQVFNHVPSYLRTIRHNQKMLKRGLFSQRRIDYNLGGALKRDWYYIDPRAD